MQLDYQNKRKKRVVYLFAGIFALYTFAFGIIDIFIDRITASIILLSVSSINIVGIILNRKNIIDYAGRSILTAGVILFAFLFYDGGIENTGILWFFAYPSIAMYLRGRIEGLFWISMIFIANSFVVLFSKLGYYPLKYSNQYILISIPIYALICYLAYFYEHSRAKSEKEINEKNKRLQKLNTELKRRDTVLSEDLRMSKHIQTNVLSYNFDLIKELDIWTHFQPMIEVGGDIYNFYKLRDNVYRLFIADATGHGVQAALTTMIIKSEYDKIKHESQNPNEILFILNKNFINKYFNLTVFFTCVIVDIDLNRKKLFYSSAGHPEQYVIYNDNIHSLNASGKMIGIVDDMHFELLKKDFLPGNKLLLFTDGIFEEFSQDGLQLGEEGLLRIIEKNKKDTIRPLIKEILNEVEKWRGDKSANDDVTLIGVEYKNF